ncbi:hypothetical protein SD70_14145 [Gordoniibacillus kamchatkensis]|uniref:SLH domain-containing protein n=1 Tax=Gordoniibacillus kamchatkensis TaxID=1590651 RepID=A0ABR5AHI8_9BACL|nr:hypothetical protein [Paenibacillus sp. VKM B-2647]KIL40372.1 hypothetical protein SD70_14145 [Paenibacillus sp. VKM B-2647]
MNFDKIDKLKIELDSLRPLPSAAVSIVSGRSGTELASKDYITRTEIAVMIQRLLQKSGLI